MSDNDTPTPNQPPQQPRPTEPDPRGAAPEPQPAAGSDSPPRDPGAQPPRAENPGSGADAPTQPAQPAPEPQAQAAQPPPAAPVAVPAARRPPRTLTMRTWLAAAVGALILVGAGLGGYFIGAATNDHHDRPGAVRNDHRPYAPGPRDFPRFRDGAPNRGPAPG